MIAFSLVILFCSCVFGRDPQNGTVTRRVINPESTVMNPAPTPSRTSGSAGQQRYRIIMEGELMRWVNGMLDRIKPHLDRVKSKGIHYRIRIIDDPSVNAMTLADGRIYLTKGLLKFIQNDDELASVIAHECGHVEMRHHSKRALKQTLWSGLAMLGAAMSKAEGEGFLGAQLLGSLATMSYSRNQEHEADRVGTTYCRAAGYNPTASVDFIKRLLAHEEETRKKSTYELSPIFYSHPPSSARAVKIEKQIEGTGPYPPKVLTYNPGRLFYAPMKWSDGSVSPSVPVTMASDSGESLFFYSNFEGEVAIGPATALSQGSYQWYRKGDCSTRLVHDKVGIGRQTLKLWSSGKDDVLLYSAPFKCPSSFGNALIEFIVSGEGMFSTNIVVILHRLDGLMDQVVLPATIEGEQGEWKLLRVSDLRKVDEKIAELSEKNSVVKSVSVGWSVSKGQRGALWIDELRFGTATLERVLDNRDMAGSAVNSATGEGLSRWKCIRGSGEVVEFEKPEHPAIGKECFKIVSPKGERYATIVSDDIDPSRLKGGYMLFFYSKAQDGVRLFAGLEYYDDSGSTQWEPAGGTALNGVWKRLRLISDEKPVINKKCRIRFEFSSNQKDFQVFLDEVLLVSLLKADRP